MKNTSGLKVTEKQDGGQRKEDTEHGRKGPACEAKGRGENRVQARLSKPDNTCQPKNAVDSAQGTHKGTDTHPETAQMLRTKSETLP